MPKQRSDKLINLIASLTKAEKRSFRLFANRLSHGDEKMFVIVFDYIDKKGNFNEDQILKKFPSIKRSQLPNIKANLYKKLLENLRHLLKSTNIEVAVRELIDFAFILQVKGMLKASLDQLEKAKKMALEADLMDLAYVALNAERKIESQYVTGSMAEKALLISKNSDQFIATVDLNNKLANLSLSLYGLYLDFGYVKNKDGFDYVKQYFEDRLPSFDFKTLGFYDKIYLYQSHVWLNSMVQDFVINYKYAKKWVELFEDNPKMIKNNMSLYIKGIHNELSATYMVYKADKFLPAYDKFLQLPLEYGKYFTHQDHSTFEMVKQIHLLNKIFLLGNYKESIKFIQPLIKELNEETHVWDRNRKIVFNYKIACVYFGAGRIEDSIDYLNLIINTPVSNLRRDIQGFARILSLIAHFELGNDLLISYQIKSVYRFLSKMEELNAVQKEIFSFLRKIPAMTRNQLKNEFIALRDKLSKYRNDPFEKRPFLYLDIIAWLDSKIQKRNIQDIIQEKNINSFFLNSNLR